MLTLVIADENKSGRLYITSYMLIIITRIRSVERGICPIAAVCTVLFYCPDVKPAIISGSRHFDLEVT